jgi:hypothetical protein
VARRHHPGAIRLGTVCGTRSEYLGGFRRKPHSFRSTAQKVALCPADSDEDLVEEPLVARPRSAPPQRVGGHPSETQPSFPNGFVADHHATCGEGQLDLAQGAEEAFCSEQFLANTD